MVCICFYLLFFSHFPPQNRICTYSQHSKNLIRLMQVWIFQCQNEKLLKLIFFVNVHWAAGEYFENFQSFTLINRKRSILFRKFFNQMLLFWSIVETSRVNEQFCIYKIRLRKHIKGKSLGILYICMLETYQIKFIES